LSGATLEQAIAALAGGRAVRISDFTFASIETATDPSASAALVVSAERAAALGLANRRDVVPGRAVRIARCDWIDRTIALALVDPGRDFDRVTPGPLAVTAPVDGEAADAGLRLARLAGLLPALWEVTDEANAVLLDIETVREAPRVTLAARARLPIADIDQVQVAVFRESGTGDEHVALIIGSWGGQPPLVRLHSECLTGDVFGSLKCDCGPQLRAALRLIDAAGGGILLYLRQEGRGIGLANKIRAYALQDRGLDTVDANRRLGFGDDERDYGVAAAILKSLAVEDVRLLTNNPAKVAGLEAAGVAIAERVAHHMPVNPHNADYIATKKRRSGHLD
jgi:GTP cyclohydrolase II